MPFVLDCSMTMAWIFEDEANKHTDALRESLIGDSALVPALWPIEVSNVVLAATRRGRISEDSWPQLFGSLSALPITIEQVTLDVAWSAALPLANMHKLSVYDAVYLELSLRRQLPLATLDRRLARACRVAGGTLAEGL